MRYVRLGKTDLQVSAIALGTGAFGGGWGEFEEDEAHAVIFRALDLGITLFDTAAAYGWGRSERVLGAAIRKRACRDEVVIATKGGLRKEGDIRARDSSPAWLRQGVEASLRNLGVETIDLYQLHWPDPTTPVDELAAVLDDFVREGKVRHVGVSNFSVEQMRDLAAHGPVETDQPPYNLLRRDIEAEILPYAAEHDIGVLVYGALAHGLLGGRMDSTTKLEPDDWRRSLAAEFRDDCFQSNIAIAGQLGVFCAERGVPLPTLAVAWTLAHPAVDVAIVGARRPDALKETVAAAAVEVTRSDLAEIERILSK